MQRRRLRRGPIAVAILLALIIVFTGAMWPVYVDPITDQPARADAIVVLGGAHDGREELGLTLAHDGYAPQVVFSNPYGDSEMINRICHGGYSFTVTCFDPDPTRTIGEAREIARLATAQHWRRVIVVTFTPHISRARYVIDRCFHGDLLMVEKPADLAPINWAWNYLYQSAGYIRAYFDHC